MLSTGIDTLGHLGVGVSLYFTLIKDFAILLFIMSLIAAPMTYVFYLGSRVPSSAPNPLGLAYFSLGNIGDRWVGGCTWGGRCWLGGWGWGALLLEASLPVVALHLPFPTPRLQTKHAC